MSVVRKDRTRSMQTLVNIGTVSSPKTKTTTYNYFAPNAELDKMLTAGQKLIACQTHTRVDQGVQIVDKYVLAES